jgi:hypothetical protein
MSGEDVKREEFYMKKLVLCVCVFVLWGASLFAQSGELKRNIVAWKIFGTNYAGAGSYVTLKWVPGIEKDCVTLKMSVFNKDDYMEGELYFIDGDGKIGNNIRWNPSAGGPSFYGIKGYQIPWILNKSGDYGFPQLFYVNAFHTEFRNGKDVYIPIYEKGKNILIGTNDGNLEGDPPIYIELDGSFFPD